MSVASARAAVSRAAAVFGVVLLALVGRDLAGQFLLGVGAFGLHIADRVEEATDLADVVAARGHPGAGGRDELVAGVDRAEAVVGDAGALGGVGQGGGDPVRLGSAAGDAAGELADGGGLVREPSAVPVESVALAGDLAGAGGHLAALVLDSALGLVLLGVLKAGQAALDVSPSDLLASRSASAARSAATARRRAAAAPASRSA